MLTRINRTKRLTVSAREQFLSVLRETCNVSEAANAVGLSRSRMYVVRDEEPEFHALWDEAIDSATDALFREARRRGYDGYEEPVFHQGKQVATIRKYSDRMLEILMKGHRPEMFVDRSESRNLNLFVDLTERPLRELTDEQFAELQKMLGSGE